MSSLSAKTWEDKDYTLEDVLSGLKATIFLLSFICLVSYGQGNKMKKGDTVNLLFLDDEKISQSESEQIEQRRLVFSYSDENIVFAGTQFTHSYRVVNANSLPKNQHDYYFGVALYNSNQDLVYKGLVSMNYVSAFEKNHKYKTIYYSGTFFLDVPASIDLSDVTQSVFVSLASNTITNIIEIDDITRFYKEPKRADGWNGESFVYRIYGSSPPERSFDFVLLTEGFTKEELQADTKDSLLESKFGQYVQEYIFSLLETEPYKSRKDAINIWVVATPSKDSGVSNPFRNKNLNTVYRATYGATCIERSLIVRDQARALEMASLTPFDQIIVIANDEILGEQGGDILVVSMNKQQASQLIKHELAHAVGMMADEYKYHSDIVTLSKCQNSLYENYSYHIYKTWGRNSHSDYEYDLAPNITNTADASQVKWKEFLNESSPIVYFNYPKAALEFDKDKFVLRGKYQSQFDREKILITMGTDHGSNNIIGFIEDVVVNGSDEEFFCLQKGKSIFVELTNCPPFKGARNQFRAFSKRYFRDKEI